MRLDTESKAQIINKSTTFKGSSLISYLINIKYFVEYSDGSGANPFKRMRLVVATQQD